MKGGLARAVAAEKGEALGVHLLRARLDAGVAHPRRIADHDVESAAGHDVSKVNVEGEEADLAVFNPLEHAPVGANALVQLAAALDVHLAQAAEQIALRRAE